MFLLEAVQLEKQLRNKYMDSIIIKEDKRLDMSLSPIKVNFVVEANKNVSLFLNNLSLNNEINLQIQEGATLTLSIISDKEIGNAAISANLAANSHLIVYFADFSNEISSLNASINLNGENAN